MTVLMGSFDITETQRGRWNLGYRGLFVSFKGRIAPLPDKSNPGVQG